MAFYLLAGLPLQWWSYLSAPLPLMNYGPPIWPNFPAYVLAGPLAAYLLWTRQPRARLAAYVFLTFDVLRSIRLAHWLPITLDIAIILYLQTPGMRSLYPSLWSRRNAVWRPWARR
ncbi:MAG: hypothetical protein HY330_05540 [Chloroflexi bacterium]|nr:hypothetical protein [Chloroflexota bacterium]